MSKNAEPNTSAKPASTAASLQRSADNEEKIEEPSIKEQLHFIVQQLALLRAEVKRLGEWTDTMVKSASGSSTFDPKIFVDANVSVVANVVDSDFNAPSNDNTVVHTNFNAPTDIINVVDVNFDVSNAVNIVSTVVSHNSSVVSVF